MVDYERKKIEKDDERNIITGMIVSTDFLKQVQYLYRPEFFSLNYAKTVAEWCIEYYQQYEKAPFSDIQSIFEVRKERIMDPERIEAISTFLDSLNQHYVEGKYNVGYEIDKAQAYFRQASLDALVLRIKGAQLMNDYDRAEAEIANYKRVAKNSCEGIEIWNDKDAVIRSLRPDNDDILFHFPGELGRLIRPWKRGDFAAIVGPAKRGKSFWLMEIAFLASLANLNVVFFSFEMTEENMLMRFYQRLTGLLEPDEHEFQKEVKIPYFDGNYEYNSEVYYKTETYKTINVRSALRRMNSIQGIVKNKQLKLICAPPNTMSVADMNAHLDNLEYYENFIPDVIIADYADITKPERKNEKRHQIDETWLAYRGLSLVRKCLVVTASHSNKATFDRDVRQNDLSEDNRKINHVTWMGALNQSEEEGEKGIMRLGVIADRHKYFNKNMEAVVLQCLDIGQVCLDSRIVRKEVG